MVLEEIQNKENAWKSFQWLPPSSVVPKTVKVAMFSLTPPSFLTWQMYFPALAGSALANCRVATLSTNEILMFSLSLITSSFSLSHWTEIGWAPSMVACSSAGWPATTVRLLSLEMNFGGSEQEKMNGDCSKSFPGSGREDTLSTLHMLDISAMHRSYAHLLILWHTHRCHCPLHSGLCSGTRRCLSIPH